MNIYRFRSILCVALGLGCSFEEPSPALRKCGEKGGEKVVLNLDSKQSPLQTTELESRRTFHAHL